VNLWLRDAFDISRASFLTFLFTISITFSFLPNAFPLGKIFLRCEQNISTAIHDQHKFIHFVSLFQELHEGNEGFLYKDFARVSQPFPIQQTQEQIQESFYFY
jgi:hypothetical protein